MLEPLTRMLDFFSFFVFGQYDTQHLFVALVIHATRTCMDTLVMHVLEFVLKTSLDSDDGVTLPQVTRVGRADPNHTIIYCIDMTHNFSTEFI